MCTRLHACMCTQRMWYVLIHGKQTAVQPGRLVLSECVYLNSPQSLSVRPSITHLRRKCALLCLAHKHTNTHTLAMRLKYDDMTVRVLLTLCDCLCHCQFLMHCCLGLYRRWCFHSGPLWPWLCKQVCKVTISEGEEQYWQGPINRLSRPCKHDTYRTSRHSVCHRRRFKDRCVCLQRERASTCKQRRSTFSCTQSMYAHATSPPAWRMTSSFEGMTLSPRCLSLGSRPGL